MELKTLLKEKAHFTTDLTPYNKTAMKSDQTAHDGPQKKELIEFKKQLLDSLADSLEGRTDLDRSPEIVAMLSEQLARIYNASGLELSTEERQRLFRAVLDDILGYGPIEPLLADSAVSEVMVNGPKLVYVERGGVLLKTSIQFDDEAHMMRIINRIIRPLGRRVDRNVPMVDARLPDGSRVNAIIAPCAIDGPSITIRKFSREKLTIDDLIGFGSITEDMALFLRACVCSRLNVVVAGGTGSGKTTLLNVLSSFIPPEERIVTIEDSAELQLQQENVVRLETASPDLDGSGEVSVRDLVRNALRMRPDRIVIGEVRGGEALDMLQAMNTGHDGSLTTVHANTARDTISRLETLVMMAGMELPLKVIRAQISSAIDVIVQQARLKDGSRKITSITEVQSMEGDVIVLAEIFAYKETIDADGKLTGELGATGIRPVFSTRLDIAGYKLPAKLFAPKTKSVIESLKRH